MDRLWIFSSLLTLAAFIVAGIALTGVLGPRGMAWANFLPLGGLLMAAALYRQGGIAFRRFLRELALLYLAPLPLFVPLRLLPVANPWLRLALSLAAALLLLVFYYHRFGRSFVAFLKDPVAAASRAAE